MVSRRVVVALYFDSTFHNSNLHFCYHLGLKVMFKYHISNWLMLVLDYVPYYTMVDPLYRIRGEIANKVILIHP